MVGDRRVRGTRRGSNVERRMGNWCNAEAQRLGGAERKGKGHDGNVVQDRTEEFGILYLSLLLCAFALIPQRSNAERI